MQTRYLDLPAGQLAYDDRGSGPLLLLLPGLGDVRQEYRLLVPELVAAGYRVVTMDLRGHGESSAGWPDYALASVAGDAMALLEELGAEPATIIGTSFAAGVAVYVAAEHPELVAGLVLIGPFVRDHGMSFGQRLVMQALFGGPWRVRAWAAYYQSLYPTRKPDDFAAYLAALRRNLAEPGRFAALASMVWESKQDSAARLARVQAATLVIMGSKDPDFPAPAAEAEQVAAALRGRVHMIDGAGHYPHAEMPAATAPAIIEFLAQLQREDATWQPALA